MNPSPRIFIILAGMILAMVGGTHEYAWAQEAQEALDTAEAECGPDSGESDPEALGDSEEDAVLEEVNAAEPPDGTQDYVEIYRMRVLERTFIPPQTVEPTAMGPLPNDPMGLMQDAAGNALGNAESPGMGGLQRKASRLMADAVAEVQKQISESGNAIVQPFGIDCASQLAVQEVLAVFAQPGSGTMKTWLKRAGRWRAALETVLAEEGVPLDLFYLAMIESGFKTRVKSPAAAAGMWQFMAGTGAEMGLRIDAYVDERFDPIKSAHAAAQYLKKQYARYHSWPLAMAAYNGGPGTVNVAIDRYQTNDYFKLVQYGAMYEETRRYVPRILAAAMIGRNPAAFGFGGIVPDPPFVYDTVEVPPESRLSQLAEAAGCSREELEELNPELLKDTTPPGRNYVLRIPSGRFNDFVDRFDRVQKKYAHATDTIALKFGETPETLGETIGVPGRVLRNLNGIGAKETVEYGTELLVPNGSRRAEPAPPKDEDKRLALISPEKFAFKKRVFYETQKGDTLRDIARAFGLTAAQLAMWNELDVWAKLRPKMMLQVFVDDVPEPKDVRIWREDQLRVVVRGSDEHRELLDAKRKSNVKTAQSSSTRRASTYTVVKGDSLSKIAKKFGISVGTLLKLNKLKAGATLRPGQKLKVRK